MVAKNNNLAWGYYSKEKGIWPETFISRNQAREYAQEAKSYFKTYQFKLVRVQLKPYVKK